MEATSENHSLPDQVAAEWNFRPGSTHDGSRLLDTRFAQCWVESYPSTGIRRWCTPTLLFDSARAPTSCWIT